MKLPSHILISVKPFDKLLWKVWICIRIVYWSIKTSVHMCRLCVCIQTVSVYVLTSVVVEANIKV